MVYFQYDARTLPYITLIGQDTQNTLHRNIRRISEDYIFYIVTEGEMFFTEGDVEYHLQKGDCFLFEPGVLHFGNSDSRYHIRYIHFRHPSIQRVDADAVPTSTGFVTLPKQMHISDAVGLKGLLSLVGEAINRDRIPLENYDVLCACSVQQTFLEAYRLAAQTDESHCGIGEHRARAVLGYLYANYPRKLTSGVLEKELSYNFDYLNQLFRRVFRTSIFQQLESIRMEAARNLILTSNLSVERIATEVGYKDATYFSKVFKKRTGLPPLKYRQTML